MPDDSRRAPAPGPDGARQGSTPTPDDVRLGSTPSPDGVRPGPTVVPQDTSRGAAALPEQTRHRPRRWPLALAVLLAAAVTLALLASWQLRPRIEQMATSALGRPVHVASFELTGLARGELAVRGIAIGEPAALAVARLAVLPSWRALLDGRVVIERIAIDGLEATVEQDADDRPAVRGLPLPSDSGHGDTSGPPVTVREISLTRATIALVPPPALRRTPVTLALDDLLLRQVPTTDQGPSWEGELGGALDGVPLTARARADRTSAGTRITAEAELTGAEIDARRLVLPPGFASLSARAGGRVTYELDPERKRDRVSADLDVADLSLGGQQDTSLAAARVQVQGLALDLVSGTANLGRITVEKPRIEAVLGPSGVIYPGLVPALVESGVAPPTAAPAAADAAARETTTPEPGAASRGKPSRAPRTAQPEEAVRGARPGPEGPSWRVTGGRIEARAGHVVVRRAEHRVALDVPSFVWREVASGKLGDLSLTVRAADGGVIDLDGRLGIDPAAIDASVRLDDVDLPSLGALAGSPLALARGNASGVVTLRGAPAAAAIEATLDVSSLHSAPPDDAQSDRVLAVDRLAMQVGIAAGAAGDVHVRSLRLSYPYAMIARDAQGIFPLTVLDAHPAAATAAMDTSAATDTPATADTPATESAPDASSARAARTIRIDRVEVDGGRVDFVDHTTSPPYWMGLASIAGSVGDVSIAPGALGTLELRARQDELHPVAASARHTGPERWQGSVSLDGMSLATLNPYLAPVLGYEAETGTLSVALRGTLDGSTLGASSAFTLDDVGLRQTGLDVIQRQTGVPLTVALGLLEDVGGEIALEVPVEVDTRTGEYALGSFVTQAIGRAVLGALSSPLRWLGMLFGTDGPPHALAIDPVPFTAGRATLDEAGTARVAQIARILQSHADLDVILKAEIAASDRDAVGESALLDLAQRRVEAVRAAFASSRSGAPILPARLIVAPWTPPPPSGALDAAPAVYVEVQSR